MDKSDLLPDPLEQFKRWYEGSVNSSQIMPDAMTLATADIDTGRPSARIVLYKGIDQGGFLIFTNYHSRKAKELIENPCAALTFYWPSISRQVRIEGPLCANISETRKSVKLLSGGMRKPDEQYNIQLQRAY